MPAILHVVLLMLVVAAATYGVSEWLASYLIKGKGQKRGSDSEASEWYGCE